MSHLSHDCSAFALICMDHRLQKSAAFQRELAKQIGTDDFDLVALAGGSRNLLQTATEAIVLSQIETSVRLHHIDTVVLANHQDCGAYGEGGVDEVLIEDLRRAKEVVSRSFPSLNVVMILMTITAGENDWIIDSRRVDADELIAA